MLSFCLLGGSPFSVRAGQGAPATPAPKSPPALGTIKTISGNTLTLTTDAGTEIKVVVSADAKLIRVPPGSKDLKEAAPLQFADLQAGDRILVRGKPGDDPNSMVASSVVAMKKTDIAEKQAHEREEWQRHGIGGLVRSVDASSGVITIGTTTATGNKDIAIHAASTTILRRYAPGSVKFDDAKPSTLAEIKTGDQLRARGTRSADGSEFTAEEIVSGAFRNIAGMIVSIDATGGSFTVNDLAHKEERRGEAPCGFAVAQIAATHGAAHRHALEGRLHGRFGFRRRGETWRRTVSAFHCTCPAGTTGNGRRRERRLRWRNERRGTRGRRRSPADAQPASREFFDGFSERRCGHDRGDCRS